MKSVAIVIPNRNGYDALPLCIESIRARTKYPHKIIVYDDFSSYRANGKTNRNLTDLEYLRACRDKEWIELHEGERPVGHGGALNFLLNARCKDEFDYAAVIDADICITQSGWLSAMIEEAEKHWQILAVCDLKAKGYCPKGFRPALYLFWFGLIKLDAYRDGMQVDWSQKRADRREEPYLSEFADLYPPEKNKYWQHYVKRGWDKSQFGKDRVVFDPGCCFYIKVRFSNPKNYRVISVPHSARQSYIHYEGCSRWLDPHNELTGHNANERNKRIASIRTEMEKLKCRS